MDISEKFNNSNPQLTANFVNRMFFWWMKPLFYSRKGQNIQMKDLYRVLPQHSSKLLGDRLERAWYEELQNSVSIKRKSSLLRVTWKTFGWLFLYYGLHVFFICVILRGLQPYVLALVIEHFHPFAKSSTEEAYCFASILVIMIILQASVGHHSVVGRKDVGMRISTGYSALIYRKALRLSASASSKYDPGKIVNLLSNDVGKFEDVCMFLHYIWVLPLQCILMLYFFWSTVNFSITSGLLYPLIATMFLIVQTVFVQKYLGKITGRVRAKVAAKADKRIRLMSEILSGIRVIKMYAWEKPFENLVFLARKSEIDLIALKSYLRGVSSAASLFAETTTLILVIFALVLDGSLEAHIIYAIAQYFGMIKTMITVFYPRAVSSSAEARVSIKRIEEFLLLGEVETKSQPENIDDIRDIDAKITIKNLCFTWKEKSSEYALQNVNLNFSQKLYIITGTVGSGKSTLLKTILEELQPASGELQIHGKVSYACQQSWLFSGTVRSNILFGLPFDKERYERVINVCALTEDLEELPNKDLTFVGNDGSTLSGGQCSRVNLARAIYRGDANIYLIDDALAAVDVHVKKHIFDKCLNGFLKDKLRILVTHDLECLKQADEIIVMKNGQVDFCGSYVDLTNKDYWLPDSPVGDANVKVVSPKNENTTDNHLELMFINSNSAKVESEGEKEELVTKKHYTSFMSVCRSYFKAGGSNFILLCLALSLILAQVCISGGDFWLASAMRDKERSVRARIDHETSIYNDSWEIPVVIGLYAVIMGASIIMWTASSLLFYKICVNASRNLHNRMFACLLRTPIRFFELNPAGRILNRFSKDTGLVDETLPTVTLDALHVLLMAAGVTIQVLILNLYFIIPLVIMVIICWKFKNIYLPTARTIMRLESKAKSPVFTHLNSTLSGLTVIRSAKAQNKIKAEFDSLQDVHTSAHYVNIASSSAFGFWLDIVSVTLLAFVTFHFLYTKDTQTSAGFVGLAITQILMLYGSVQYGLRQTTAMMTQMISVERIFNFTNLEQEGPFETELEEKVLKNWPNKGAIQFENLSLKYSDNKEPALKDVTLNIKPQEKIGVVGRTGAGKTSLISVLFRLVNPEGSLYIDEIDIKSIGLYDLRSRISIIPQDPVLFTTSLKNNLDPLHKYSDKILWQALEDVELKSQFNSLEYRIENKGSNLSTGQKQLLCLARAIITRNNILILDEATSNIDAITDEIIQKIIKIRFSNCTVITVAHRLSTVLNSDRILVMDHGKAVEFDTPSILMQQKDGYFYNMMNN